MGSSLDLFVTVHDPDKGQTGREGEGGMERLGTTATSGEWEHAAPNHNAGALPQHDGQQHHTRPGDDHQGNQVHLLPQVHGGPHSRHAQLLPASSGKWYLHASMCRYSV